MGDGGLEEIATVLFESEYFSWPASKVAEGFRRAGNRISCGQDASRNSNERRCSAIDNDVSVGNGSGTRISDTKTDGYAQKARQGTALQERSGGLGSWEGVNVAVTGGVGGVASRAVLVRTFES